MKKVKITKRQLKEDELVQVTFKATSFVQEHLNAIVITILAIAIIAGGISLYNFYHSKNLKEASVLFYQAYLDYKDENFDNALTNFQKLYDSYSGTSIGKEALMYLGNIYYRKAQFEDAQKYFKKCAGTFSDEHPFNISAKEGLAACFEAQGNFEDAAKNYKKIALQVNDKVISPRNLMAAGRAYDAAGKRDEAQKLFQEIVDNYPDSAEKIEAQNKLTTYKYLAIK